MYKSINSIFLCLSLLILIFIGCNKKNPIENEQFETSTLMDIDGNIYKTIKIGEQWWMAENLRVTHFRNGDVIPFFHIISESEWANLDTAAYCAPNNDILNIVNYGCLYNGFTILDNRNIAPHGWHVPTDDEFKILEMYLGMSQSEADGELIRGLAEGGKLKATGTREDNTGLWYSPNTGATNESGFSALPGGVRTTECFEDFGREAVFWTASAGPSYNPNLLYYRMLFNNDARIHRVYSSPKRGFSIRLIKDN